MSSAAVPAPDFSAAEAAWQRDQARQRWRRRLLPLAGGGVLLAVWWLLIVVFGVRPFIAPSPIVVVQTLAADWQKLLLNLIPTAIESLAGFALGNIAALAIAVAFVHSRTSESMFYPVAVLINAIPVVAKAPILLLLLGNGLEPKIAIAALICFFPTLVNMVKGLQAVSPQAMELMHVLSATRAEVFWKLRLYASLPFLFSALRISASTAVIGAIVGEWIGSQVGIGALIMQATYNFDSALLYATVVVGSLFSVAFFMAVDLAERLVIRWQPANS